MKDTQTNRTKIRKRIQQIVWVLVPAAIILGLIYPLVGFFVLFVMLVGFFGGMIMKGRWVCVWLCPRGAFYDQVVSKVSPKKKIPSWLRNRKFRWAIFILLMGLMVYQISLNPTDPYHWGAVFIRICLITTIIGIVLALFIHPRTWCTFCPMGTWQSAFKKSKSSDSLKA